ncbi:MAG: sulfite exporter TauE/SafE family protein [Thermodesulfobacteriota bacterium]|nr:sulfite exporter TauE/SafE family protein [Thermodesulfobacteriota bacterium]
MQVNIIYYLTATLLGGMHALEPGHGKTVVAAYLIGTKGKKIDAVVLGLVVTLTHTFSVILLAIAAKVASTRMTLTDESLHGYIGLAAGLLILAVGIWMLVQRIRGKDPFQHHGHSHPHHHNHNHSHDHEHVHHDLKDHSDIHSHHDHDHDYSHVHGEKKEGYWQLFLLGVSGGLVPCPAAIAILLASLGTGRLGEGLIYILLFSLGLASVLIAIGITVVSAGKFASRFLDAKQFANKIAIVSAGFITLIGAATLINSIRHLI